MVDLEERRRVFHETCGAFGYISARGPTGANHHPDRCTCQGDDTTPHKHYNNPPYACARCGKCNAYTPLLVSTPTTIGRVIVLRRSLQVSDQICWENSKSSGVIYTITRIAGLKLYGMANKDPEMGQERLITLNYKHPSPILGHLVFLDGKRIQ
jgi:hypothetical protein